MDKGMEDAGIEIRWQVEIDRWCRSVLRRHWPNVRRYEDVRQIRKLPQVDVLWGGFPCQPVSQIGHRAYNQDYRWLWPEFHRIIDLLQPDWVVIENVTGLQTHGLNEILYTLAGSGYDAEWDRLPAAAFGAPHLRYRIFVVAYPQAEKEIGNDPRIFDERWQDYFKAGDYIASYAAINEGLPRRVRAKAKQRARKMGVTRLGITHGRSWPVEPEIHRVAYGVPHRLDRTRALGNAVVPRVAEWIGRRIVEADGYEKEI
jgi:DNA (cytosine-5)-methyltransferase 1